MEQTATKTVTHGIYSRVSTGKYVGNYEQFRCDKVGERVNTYTFEVINANALRINGNAYRIEDNSEFAIKIMKTKIKAQGGASGLLKFFMRDSFDSWELKVIENCKPINK